MSFSQMRYAVSHLLPRVYEHPFNQHLFQGTLPRKTFRYYLEQDALYLRDFSRALAMVSKRLPNNTHAESFKFFSEKALQTEQKMHAVYLGGYQTLFSSKKKLEKNEVIAAYTSHLLNTAHSSSIEASVACLIPCFWLYSELGAKVSALNLTHDHPYKAWLASYQSQQFVRSAQVIINIAEEMGKEVHCIRERDKIIAAFVKSTEYEISFWDSVSPKIENSPQHVLAA